ncbi:hypothetical protein OVN18_01390 [Microcella daejeonensis]|uniref:Uncharacterized protein n=1 Tax=Microcella daejeonensis TaxID=2994971 RepID=A0A9E8MLH1_9MICO|nr:hypothetical protein [Microcella daejeonensis]WAB81701.1 hypothetical protein OVN18_01390 [Microcella daejeonensis]
MSAPLAAGMLLLGLAACTPFGSGPDRDAEAIAVVDRAIEEAVPEANGVFVTMAFSGPSDRTMRVRLYIDPVDEASLADAVDRSIAEAWASSPIAVVELAIEAVAGEPPEVPPGFVEQVIDLRPVAAAIGIESRDVVDRRIALSEVILIERYGPAGRDEE